MTNATTTATFQVGTTYRMGWHRVTIIRRTAKSVWIKDIMTQAIVRKAIQLVPVEANWIGMRQYSVEKISPTACCPTAPDLYATDRND